MANGWGGRVTSIPRARRRVDCAEPPEVVEVDSGPFRPLAEEWFEPGRWETLYERQWLHPEEHINTKEARVALQCLKRECRSARAVGGQSLYIGDSMVSTCAFSRGRAKALSLNCLCRQAASYQVAANHRWHLRHCRSEQNQADEGSRRFETKIQRRISQEFLAVEASPQ